LAEPVVLVVEDDADTRTALVAALDDEIEQPIVIARDGEEAIARARAYAPAVVLLDIGLPKVDGYEVARALRADPATAAAWIVAITGTGRPRDAARAGVDQFLWKPLDLEHLSVAVRAGMDRAGARMTPAEIDRLTARLAPLADAIASGAEQDAEQVFARIAELLQE
jgi:CheY-like chemotaxis protein